MNTTYDIALSFAGEDRPFVKRVALGLRRRNIKVFYDEFENHRLWGEDLYQELATIYQQQARFVVIFASQYYARKAWPTHELRSAQARALAEKEGYILLARFDDTEIPGILPTIGYLDLRNKKAAEVVSLIVAKLKTREAWSRQAEFQEAKPLIEHHAYVCLSAQHTIYITKQGDLFYRNAQVLRLNRDLEKLPCSISLSAEKQFYYGHSQLLSSVNEIDFFRDYWIFNNFAVWRGEMDCEKEGEEHGMISSFEDAFGTTTKNADLQMLGKKGQTVTRETLTGLRDYVMWREPGGLSFDSFDVAIDIPTSQIEISVVIDKNLYRNLDENEIGPISLQFVNSDSALLEGSMIMFYPGTEGAEIAYGRNDDYGYEESLRKVQRLGQRAMAILEARTTTNRPEEILKTLSTIPSQDVRFFRMCWHLPYSGIKARLRWEAPPSDL